VPEPTGAVPDGPTGIEIGVEVSVTVLVSIEVTVCVMTVGTVMVS